MGRQTPAQWMARAIGAIPMAERTAFDYVYAIEGSLQGETLPPEELLHRAYSLAKSETLRAAYRASRMSVTARASEEASLPAGPTLADLLRMAAQMADDMKDGK